jgi:multiple sugar transport system substrate-binding protein/sn-glycerol 3-phosphate transport system substrate-binding protein
MTSLVEDFNGSNEWGITVVEESQGGYNDLYTKIIAGIPAKQLPNMSVAYQNQAATYAVQGVLVELDPYVNDPVWGYTEAELADSSPIALAADYLPSSRDATVGLPTSPWK